MIMIVFEIKRAKVILSYESHILRVCDVWSPRRRDELVAAAVVAVEAA